MFKEQLIVMIAKNLSEETCGRILSRIGESYLANEIKLCNKDWKEDLHPREDDGRFAPGGSGRKMMTKREAKKWDETGRTTDFKGKKTDGMREIEKLKAKIKKLEADIDKPHLKQFKEANQRDLAKAQRDLAEWTRIEKSRRRLDLENGVAKRVLKKKVNEFRELEDEIDYFEEKMADRDPDSPTHGELVFPQTKEGQKAKKKYDALLQKRDDLDAEIDWDKVAEFDDETEEVISDE